jgi:hypothetical protein
VRRARAASPSPPLSRAHPRSPRARSPPPPRPDTLSALERRILEDLHDPTGLALVNTAAPLGYDSAGGATTTAAADAPFLSAPRARDTPLTGSVAGEAPEAERPVQAAFAAPMVTAQSMAAAAAAPAPASDEAAATTQ